MKKTLKGSAVDSMN